MRTALKLTLAGTVSFITLTAAVHASAQAPVDTAGQASASSDGLEEIVVTARRRDEKAQTVPIVMDVFTQQELTEQDIREAQDLTHLIPGLMTVSSTRGMSSFVFVRGVPGVVVYFADVPLGGGAALTSSGTPFVGGAYYFDLDNVQALKGPQGTLFGLNADAGAVLFDPKKPTDDFEGYGQITLGDYNRHTFEGVVNIPVVPNKLDIRVGGEYSHTDGFQYDEIQNKYLNNDDFWIGRFSATARPSDEVENYFMLNYYYSDTDGADLVPYALNPKGSAALRFPAIVGEFAQQQALGPYTSLGSTIVGGSIYKIQQLNIADTLTWNLSDDLLIKNIAGYTEITTLNRTDFSGTPAPIDNSGSGTFQGPGPYATYSDEVQVQGKSLNEQLNWVVGGFLSFGHQTDPRPIYSQVLGSTSGTITGESERTQAIYTQGTYDLSEFLEGLSFTAGYRYSWDWRSAFSNSTNSAGTTLLVFASDAQFHAPGYTFNLDYKLAPQTLVYTTYSKAYSSGGFNLTAPSPSLQKYNPEYLSDVEVGIKSDWTLYGAKARTNLGGFYGWYDNIQANQLSAYTNATGTHFTTVVTNAATAHIEGIEAEFTILPIEGLELSGNGLLMNAHYDNYISGGVNLDSTPFFYLPKLKYSVTARYKLPVDAALGEISVGGTYTWQRHLLKSSDTPPFGYLPSFGNLDIDVAWNDLLGRPFDLSFFMTNVTNNQTNVGGFGAYSALGVAATGVANPRMYGFRLRYRFGPGLSFN